MSSVVYTYAVVLNLMGGAYCQGTVVLSISSNPVYSGETVVLTCNYGDDNTPSFVTIDAFNCTHNEGSLWCRVPKPNVTGYGVFSGKNVSGCPSIIAGSTRVSVSMTASPSLELDYNCSAIVTNVNAEQHTLRSSTTSLLVHVLPSVPKFVQNPLTFNDGADATLVCKSHNGKPASAVMLTVSALNGSQLAASGIGSASLTLFSPLINWHNVTATCNVTNHKFSNMTTSSSVLINHISCASSSDAVKHNSEIAVLDCSTYISSHPAPNYTWSFRPEINATSVKSLLRVPVSAILQSQSETFNCTAINGIIKQAVIVVITVNNSHLSSIGKELTFGQSSQCSLTSVPAFEPFFGKETASGRAVLVSVYTAIPTIVVVAVTLVIYCKRNTLLKKMKEKITTASSWNRSSIANEQREEIEMVDNDVYSKAHVGRSNGSKQHICNRGAMAVEDLGSGIPAESLSDTEEHHYAEVSGDRNNLLYFPSTSNRVQAQVKVEHEPDEKDFIETKAIVARLDII